MLQRPGLAPPFGEPSGEGFAPGDAGSPPDVWAWITTSGNKPTKKLRSIHFIRELSEETLRTFRGQVPPPCGFHREGLKTIRQPARRPGNHVDIARSRKSRGWEPRHTERSTGGPTAVALGAEPRPAGVRCARSKFAISFATGGLRSSFPVGARRRGATQSRALSRAMGAGTSWKGVLS